MESALYKVEESKNIRPITVKMSSAQGSTFEVNEKCKLELQLIKSDLVVTPVLFTEVDIILCNDFFSQNPIKLITYPHKEPLFIIEITKYH